MTADASAVPRPISFEDYVLIDGKWRHLVVTFKPPFSHTLYLDGVEVQARAMSAIYDKVLTQEQVQAHYDAGRINEDPR